MSSTIAPMRIGMSRLVSKFPKGLSPVPPMPACAPESPRENAPESELMDSRKKWEIALLVSLLL